MRRAAANISSLGACSWSSKPSAAATPPLVVATTGKPAATTARAEATSHAFGSTSGMPGTWSERRSSHREAMVWRLVMSSSCGEPRRSPAVGPLSHGRTIYRRAQATPRVVPCIAHIGLFTPENASLAAYVDLAVVADRLLAAPPPPDRRQGWAIALWRLLTAECWLRAADGR